MSSPVSTRLTEAMASEVQTLIYGPRLAQEIIGGFTHVVDINQAHTVMLLERGLVTREVARALARALSDLEREGPASIGTDASREDVHFNFEATLIARTGSGAGGRVHIGRSRNDMGATMDRLRARNACIDLCRNVAAVRRALLRQGEAYANVVMSGYTHLRPAQPITYGFYLLGIASALERDHGRLANAYATINRSPMGAAAFAGTSFAVDRDRVASLLGFDGLVEHAQDAVASRDFLVELACACMGTAITWSRLAQDLYVWSTDEFGLIELPDNLAGTSSIMPQKKNPVVMEFLKASSAECIGQLVSMLSTMRVSHFTNSIDGVRAPAAAAWPLFDSANTSLALTRLLVESCVPNRSTMLRKVRSNFSTLTDAAELLVRDFDLSFREAHHVAGTAARMALDAGRGSSQLDAAMLGEAAQRTLGRPIEVSADLVRSCTDPERSIEQRRSRGAVCPEEIAELHARLAARLAEDLAVLEERTQARDAARQALKAANRAVAEGVPQG